MFPIKEAIQTQQMRVFFSRLNCEIFPNLFLWHCLSRVFSFSPVPMAIAKVVRFIFLLKCIYFPFFMGFSYCGVIFRWPFAYTASEATSCLFLNFKFSFFILLLPLRLRLMSHVTFVADSRSIRWTELREEVFGWAVIIIGFWRFLSLYFFCILIFHILLFTLSFMDIQSSLWSVQNAINNELFRWSLWK